jgi:hypothetical protein
MNKFSPNFHKISVNVTSYVTSILGSIHLRDNKVSFLNSAQITDEIIKKSGHALTDDDITELKERVSTACSMLYKAGKVRRTTKRISNRAYGYFMFTNSAPITIEDRVAIKNAVDYQAEEIANAAKKVRELLNHLSATQLLEVATVCNSLASDKLRELEINNSKLKSSSNSALIEAEKLAPIVELINRYISGNL